MSGARADVIVVGAGIVGAACARALAQRGISVLMLDAGDTPGAATEAAAGMLAPLAEAKADDPLLALSVRARDLYSELVPALEEETGLEIGLRLDGIFDVAFSEKDVVARRSEVAWQRQSGFAAEWLSEDELRERLPGIGPDALGAVLSVEDGALEPVALRDALLASAAGRGTRVERGVKVEEIVVQHDRVTAVRTPSDTHTAGAIVVAAGCWSGRIAGLPRPLSVEPIRGQIVALDWPKSQPPAIIYGGGGYVTPRRGEALAGSTMEYAGFDASVTTDGVNRVLHTASRILPDLIRTPQRREWAGLRPGTPDGRPIVGPDPGVGNLWYATGHGRNGILLAGMTGEIVARRFTGEVVEHELGPLDPGRFWSL
jgi:glycine oxidase